MKIILRENVEKLGMMGEILEVKNGYARNYLIPTEKAYPAISSYMNIIRGEIETKRKILEKEREVALAKAKEMENITVTIEVAVGDEDKMFGSVTNQQIAAKLAEQGYDIDRKKIVLDTPIKALGIYHVPFKLHYDVSVDIKVWVVKEQDENRDDHADESTEVETIETAADDSDVNESEAPIAQEDNTSETENTEEEK